MMNRLNKEAVRITKSTRSDIIEGAENTFLLFGQEIPKLEIFGIKNLNMEEFGEPIEEENSLALSNNGTVIVIFVHDILKTMTEKESRSIIGHEIGHFLFGHLEVQKEIMKVLLALANVAQRKMQNYDYLDLEISCYLLSQMQELSADRVGLMISQDLDSTITGLAKLSGGFISDKINIQDYINQAMENPPGAEDILGQTHPYHPHRSWALAEFNNSDKFMTFLGKEGGKPLSEFSNLLPRIIPFPTEDRPKPSLPLIEDHSLIDELILEFYLYSSIANADTKFTPAEEKAITKFIPSSLREEIFQKWDKIAEEWTAKSADELDKIDEEMMRTAAKKDSKWKTKVIKNMLKVIKSDRRLRQEELDTMAEVVEEMDAKEECRKYFLKEFGYDPYV
jgi:hypothetical protein